MSTKIDSKAIFDIGDDIYYNPEFLDHVSSMADFLRNDDNTSVIDITPQERNVYNGDFRGYLFSIGIADFYHPFLMRVNGFKSSDLFTESVAVFYQPSFEKINEVIQMFNGYRA